MAKKKKNKTQKKPAIRFPQGGTSPQVLLQQMQALKGEDTKWKQGKTFSLVYHPGEEIMQMVKDAYMLFASENALNPTAFPSLRRMEAEVISMCADLFRGDDQTIGSMTSGGTESILLAVKTARAWAKKHKPSVKIPEIVLPVSAHPAFHKAFHYFGVKGVLVPVNEDGRANLNEVWSAVNRNTAMIVGSAPSYPHGVVDPIEKMAEIALDKEILMHVDACVGGFMLPFARELGYQFNNFDFSVPGVTSISADIHKYGYAAKGASVIMYKNRALRKKQFFIYTQWTGGIYASPGMGGTRPGGAIAAAWAALNGIGMDGYLKLAKTALKTTRKFKATIESIPELQLIAQPDMTLLALGSDKLNIYAIGDELSVKGWHIDRQQDPACLHLTISPIHAEIADEFLEDLQAAVDQVKKLSLHKIGTNIQVAAVKGLKKVLPDNAFGKLQQITSGKGIGKSKRTAAMYGMMGALSGSGELDDLVLDFMDKLNSLD